MRIRTANKRRKAKERGHLPWWARRGWTQLRWGNPNSDPKADIESMLAALR